MDTIEPQTSFGHNSPGHNHVIRGRRRPSKFETTNERTSFRPNIYLIHGEQEANNTLRGALLKQGRHVECLRRVHP